MQVEATDLGYKVGIENDSAVRFMNDFLMAALQAAHSGEIFFMGQKGLRAIGSVHPGDIWGLTTSGYFGGNTGNGHTVVADWHYNGVSDYDLLYITLNGTDKIKSSVRRCIQSTLPSVEYLNQRLEPDSD